MVVRRTFRGSGSTNEITAAEAAVTTTLTVLEATRDPSVTVRVTAEVELTAIGNMDVTFKEEVASRVGSKVKLQVELILGET